VSLVTRTKLGVGFWVRFGTFTTIPLLSLLILQFRALNNALFSWLEPAVSALKGGKVAASNVWEINRHSEVHYCAGPETRL
jgi:hypothetical protein